ncbi:MAG: hypothetical protein A4E45_01392 [Methanosaeta sp. PtaB.Bin039]|nr:MAG: hypothetical protein A4E45_01392 [Methanosaeta sp. PtaB.Bin039]OPY47651.1 MAG: hypothetical protein A4E47_00167 [Methanosaeta sp. PtaU1.Bin028]HOT07794.1 hypothetical protein [Methanotrichaceae archaeon]HQF16398.1 hypothetical protein [Methanotrichaceae archaeon]HQI90988.1 hypothetical protein [Methanotrichaceae archaeon]
MFGKRYVCGCCGAEIDVKKTKKADFADGWMECQAPEGRDWKVPAGKKELADGTIYYLDTYNNIHRRTEFIELFAVDPERAFQFMRRHIRIKRKSGQ